MRVLLVLGSKSEQNAEKLREQRDSLDVIPYTSLKEMMENISQRNIKFDRLVISTASMNTENAMKLLHKFLREHHPVSTVVYIYKKNSAEHLAKQFNTILNSPLYTDMSLETSNIAMLEESATGDIDEIRAEYSIKDYSTSATGVIDDSYPEEDIEQLEQRKEEATQKPMLVIPQSRKQKGRGIMYTLKGLPKKEKQIKEINIKHITHYMKYVQRLSDAGEHPKEYYVSNNSRLSRSNPSEVLKAVGINNENGSVTNNEQNKNSGNLVENPAFTQLELGYYGFSTSYKDKPMMLRTGISVTQARN